MKTIKETSIKRDTLRLVTDRNGYAGIIVSAGKVVKRIDGTDADDVWRRLHGEYAASQPEFFGFDGAMRRFRRIFPGGFSSTDYAARERDYKVAAKARLDDTVPLNAALADKGHGEAVLAVYRETNLLSPFEMMRLQDALRGPNADAFVHGAAQFASGDIKLGLSAMAHALKPHDVAKWTAVTFLPYLWRPDSHMFLKPAVTRDFAERVGHAFAYDYRPSLDAEVYMALLQLANETRSEIADLGPRDNIDIQSFIWVVTYYDKDSETGATE